MKQEKSCGAVIFRKEGNDERKYLFLHYEAGHWDFVKGSVEKDEQEKETVIRETKEETGITDLVFVEGFKENINYFYKREKQRIKKEVVYYLAETKTEKITISHEHVGYAWLNFEDACKRLTFESAKTLLEKADSFLSNA